MVKTEQKMLAAEASKSTMALSSSSISNNNNNNKNMKMKKKKYKGVRMRSWGSWVSEIRAPNQKTRIWLGSYSTAEAAARAYDAALLCLKGPSAANNLNFPFNSSFYHHIDHHTSTTLSPKAIQRVAAAAATAENVENNDVPSPPLSSTSTSTNYSSSPLSHEDQLDEVSLLPTFDHLATLEEETTTVSMMAHWYNFDSPKYNDMLHGTVFFDPPLMEEVYYEEGSADIPLWSFC
ncbi:ethylene-responsive transcription factor ERF014-like [Nicotiana tomentosiformis]|uniref:ethylene-responsive transcription factor ERF014-like n=1 Tax=Nicotiana tomentosiformis TaxID=4098 RepID=UPI00051B48AD|nr:ethylene-responsive transcription factor ERF014-like [Nicotiana tomentosiformis]